MGMPRLFAVCLVLAASPASAEGPRTPIGFDRGAGAWSQVLEWGASGYAHATWLSCGWSAYALDSGPTRVAPGDLDGDGRDECVIGFGPYPGSGGWIRIIARSERGYEHRAWARLPWSAYCQSNGETLPACGDLDGDGRDEVVIGLGQGGAGILCVLDGALRPRAWLRLPWASYARANGETRPTCGDLDGDGRDEVVVGLGPYAGSGGWLAVFEDAAAGFPFRGWIRSHFREYCRGLDGQTHPAAGDLDGDGRSEIVLGLGPHPRNGGWVEVLDGTGRHAEWLRLPWPEYNAANGEVRPSIQDLGDERAPVQLWGLGAGGQGLLECREGRLGGSRHLAWVQAGWREVNARSGATWPGRGSFASERTSFLPCFEDDFEADRGWTLFEEIVGGNSHCYGDGIADLARVPEAAMYGGLGLRVWANRALAAKSNHVIAGRKHATSGQRGTWRYEFHARIDASTASTGQTGPEFSLQNTREVLPGDFRTFTAGLQYQSTPWAPEPGTWAIWTEAAPGVALWSPFLALPLMAGEWYHVALEVDYDANRYVRAWVRGRGVDWTADLAGFRIAAEPKWREEAFWISLECENLWSNGTGRFENRVHYDGVRLSRR